MNTNAAANTELDAKSGRKPHRRIPPFVLVDIGLRKNTVGGGIGRIRRSLRHGRQLRVSRQHRVRHNRQSCRAQQLPSPHFSLPLPGFPAF